MRPVNLIPPEERRGESAPLRAGILSYAIVGVLGAALLGVVALVLTGNTISEKQAELASLETQQLAAQQRAQELAPYGEFATMAQSRRATISSLADSRFDWDRVLHELALVIPDDVWLDSLTGSVAPGVTTAAGDTGSGTAPTDTSITGPSLQITGCADGQVAVAGFVAALKDIDGVTRVGMQQSVLPEETSGGGAAAAAEGSTGDCQTRNFIAAFEITVAFDAVPAPPTAAASPSTTAAPVPATTTEDGGTAEVAAQQETADASAEEQSAEANTASAAAGAG